jgi:hypothetical protein
MQFIRSCIRSFIRSFIRSLKPPGFNPLSLSSEKKRFQILLSNAILYRYDEDDDDEGPPGFEESEGMRKAQELQQREFAAVGLCTLNQVDP